MTVGLACTADTHAADAFLPQLAFNVQAQFLVDAPAVFGVAHLPDAATRAVAEVAPFLNAIPRFGKAEFGVSKAFHILTGVLEVGILDASAGDPAARLSGAAFHLFAEVVTVHARLSFRVADLPGFTEDPRAGAAVRRIGSSPFLTGLPDQSQG